MRACGACKSRPKAKPERGWAVGASLNQHLHRAPGTGRLGSLPKKDTKSRAAPSDGASTPHQSRGLMPEGTTPP